MKGRAPESSLDAAWSAAGPTNLAGRVKALAIDVTDNNIMLAGGVSGAMFRSTDGGSSWSNTSQPAQYSGATCLAQDPRPGKTSIWYYGTGEGGNNSEGYWGANGMYTFGTGIYKSTDGGVEWSVLPSSVPNRTYLSADQFQFISNVVVDPVTTASDIVYAAAWGSIQRSTDGGGSWSQVLGSGFTSPTGADLAITSGGVLYATLSSSNSAPGIWRSTDGISWTNITPSGWPAIYTRTCLAIAPSNQNVVYVIAYTPGAGLNNHSLWKYTYLSGNGSGAGGAWENRSASIPNFADNAGRKFDSGGGVSMMISVKPDNLDVVFIGGVNLYRSTDGFALPDSTTWIGGFLYRGVNSPYGWWAGFNEPHHADQHVLVFPAGSPQTMFSANDGGVFKTVNNLATLVDWTPARSRFVTAQYYTVAIDHATAGNGLIIGGLQDQGTIFTDAAAGTGVKIDAGDGAWCAIADGRTSYYTSSQYGLTYRSIHGDDGLLHGQTRIDPSGLTNEVFLASFVLDPNNNARMYFAGGKTLWRNNNLIGIPLGSYLPTTVNWDNLTTTQLASGSVSAIGVSTTPANRVYYGSSNGQLYRLDRADTALPSPVNVWSGKGFPSGGYVGCIAVDPANADYVLVSFSNYGVQSIYATSDGGTSWSPVSGNLEEGGNPTGNGPSVRWIRILPLGSSVVYFAATSTGLYSTSALNGGSTIWVQEGASTIGNAVVDMVDARPADGLVVAATHGIGLFTAKFPPLTLTAAVQNGWNMVSLPVHGGDHQKVSLFPNASTPAFAYQGSYLRSDTLREGAGYWVKFGADQNVSYAGTPAARETIDVSTSWNLIGSISSPVAISGLTSVPGGIVTSRFYGYDGTYTIADSILPGKAYWVKVNQEGKLILGVAGPVSGVNRIRIADDPDLPPAPPGADMADVKSRKPASFALLQNYPNPFNPSTTIRFELPRVSRVSVKVYDVAGRDVETLVDDVESPGFKQVTFDAAGMPSGVYFCRIVAGSFTAVRKMALIR